MMAFRFVGSCVDNPFRTDSDLSDVIDRGKEITKHHFLERCEVDKEELEQMRQFPDDYTYHSSSYDGNVVYFYAWSRIEHFFMRR